MIKVCIVYDNLGPYHIARINSLRSIFDIHVIEAFDSSFEYSWKSFDTYFKKTTLNSFTLYALIRALSQIKPNVIIIPGWSSGLSLRALICAKFYNIPIIVQSDTQESDFPRSRIKEFVKSQILKCASAFFVAGIRHSSYLNKLGIQDYKIFFGCDVVDNNHFNVKKCHYNDHQFKNSLIGINKYFLVVSRLVPKKNIEYILNEYANFRKLLDAESAPHLVIMGDGLLKDQLTETVKKLDIHRFVVFAGFVQYDALPFYYKKSLALIHASLNEQWGLVVNEAMSAGIPVIVSNVCGCVPELVVNGVNGFTFDPTIKGELSNLLFEFCKYSPREIELLGNAAKIHADKYGLDYFRNNLKDCVDFSVKNKLHKGYFLPMFIIFLFAIFRKRVR